MSEDTIDTVVKIVAPVATVVAGALAAWLKKATKETGTLRDKNQELAEKQQDLVEKLKIAENKLNKEQAILVARGLAVGYYGNFIGSISSRVENGGIQVRLHESDQLQKGTLEPFAKGFVDLFCIIPEELSDARIGDCFDRLKSYQKGAIILDTDKDKRDFTIHYALSARDGARVLQIYDVAKPLFALRDYLEKFRTFVEKIGENKKNLEWQNVTQPAIQEFRDTLETMRKGRSIKFEFDTVR